MLRTDSYWREVYSIKENASPVSFDSCFVFAFIMMLRLFPFDSAQGDKAQHDKAQHDKAQHAKAQHDIKQTV